MDTHNQPVASNQKPKLLDQVKNTCRLRHYSIRTEQAYVQWAKQFILYHGKRHPAARRFRLRDYYCSRISQGLDSS